MSTGNAVTGNVAYFVAELDNEITLKKYRKRQKIEKNASVKKIESTDVKEMAYAINSK
jgi:hypothetical protein